MHIAMLTPVVPKDSDVKPPLSFDFHQNRVPQFIIKINVTLCIFDDYHLLGDDAMWLL
jgi:hypothetical protein